MNDVPASRSMVRTSTQTSAIDQALAAAQGEYPEVPKNKTAKVQGTTENGSKYSYDFKYADIADVLAACRPILSKHKIAVTQIPMVVQGHLILYTRLIHGGEFYESEWPIASIDGRLSQQKIGASLTYARRYSLCAMAGIAAEEDVDSGEPPVGSQESPAPGKRQQRPAPTVVSSPAEPEGSTRNKQPLPPRAGEKTATHQQGEAPELPAALDRRTPTPSLPEPWREYVRTQLMACKTVDETDALWEDKFLPRLEESFPPDADDLVGVYQNARRRFEP